MQGSIPQRFSVALDAQASREDRQGFLLDLIQQEVLPRLPEAKQRLFLHIGANRCAQPGGSCWVAGWQPSGVLASYRVPWCAHNTTASSLQRAPPPAPTMQVPPDKPRSRQLPVNSCGGAQLLHAASPGGHRGAGGQGAGAGQAIQS